MVNKRDLKGVRTVGFARTVLGVAILWAIALVTNAPAQSWDWDFGDGSPHSSLQNPYHTYADPGTYIVTLTVTYLGQTCTKTGTVVVGCVAPSVDDPPDPTGICPGQTATLAVSGSGTGPLHYAWYQGTSGDTFTPAPGGSDAPSYTTPALTVTTVYWVRVINACSETADSPTAVVTVKAGTALTSPPRNQVFDAGQAVTFTVSAAGTGLHYQWYQGETGSTAQPVGTDSTTWVTPALYQTTPYWVRVSGDCGVLDSPTAWATMRQSTSTAAFDFNGDGRSDILWRNDVNGNMSVWYLAGWGLLGSGNLGGISDLAWQVAGVGDFNGDGVSDLLWRRTDTGEMSVWLTNGDGSGILRSYSLGTVDPAWKIVGAGDSDADGRADIFWRHDASGTLSLWFIDETGLKGTAFVGGINNPDWRVLGADDFNGDGKADIFWRHLPTGTMSVWFVTENGYSGDMSPGSVDPSWTIVGFGDADLDGRSDVFWRHDASGTLSLWFIDETGLKGTAFVGGISNLDWVVKGIGDFSGDGKADILWRYLLTGDLSVWFVTEGGYAGDMSPGSVDLVWETLNLVNFNSEGDGEPARGEASEAPPPEYALP